MKKMEEKEKEEESSSQELLLQGIGFKLRFNPGAQQYQLFEDLSRTYSPLLFDVLIFLLKI
jgi:hypothetical protein